MLLSSGCANDNSNKMTVQPKPQRDISQTKLSNQSKPEENNSFIPANTSEPFIGHIDLDSETEKFLYGTWKVEKLLGFGNSWNDASEYPTGQKIIGDEIVIKKDFFSSKGLENYNAYQYELKNPSYSIAMICYNGESFYRIWKIDLDIIKLNDTVKSIEVFPSPKESSIPLSFFDVNNNTLILLLESTCFELKKVAD